VLCSRLSSLPTLSVLLPCVVLVAGCGSNLSGATTETSMSASSISEVAQATCTPYSGDKLTFCMETISDQCASYAAVHTVAYVSPQAADCFVGAYARHSGRANPCGSDATCASGFNGGASSPGTAASPVSSTRPIDKTAPNPQVKPAFSFSGKTEHGDTVRLEGRFGPILPPDESDVDQEALAGCPESDGRDLVRQLDLTITITSSLSGDVQVVAPTVALNDEEGAEEIRKLDFIMSGPEGAVCSKGLGNTEGGYMVDLGSLQPHERSTLPVWVVLIDAITPAEPHPSLKRLQTQEWLMTNPTVRVDGVDAISGGSLSATKRRHLVRNNGGGV
jgi:hypothetical protein